LVAANSWDRRERERERRERKIKSKSGLNFITDINYTQKSGFQTLRNLTGNEINTRGRKIQMQPIKFQCCIKIKRKINTKYYNDVTRNFVSYYNDPSKWLYI
jgi:hypothetical protein